MNQHIIYRQKATIMVAQEANARAVQNEISDVIKHELPQLLQDIFDLMVPEGNIIRIDSLQLDLGTLPAQNIQQVFKERVAEKIKAAITLKKEETVFKNGTVTVRKEQSLREAFIYFLEHGITPWFMGTKNRNEWESAMQLGLTNSDWQKMVVWLRQNHGQQPVIVERLVHQFSDDLLEQVITNTVSFGDEDWKDIYHDLSLLITKERIQLLSLCLSSFLQETSLADALYHVLKNGMVNGNLIKYAAIKESACIATTKTIADIFERLKLEESPSIKRYDSSHKALVDKTAKGINADKLFTQSNPSAPKKRNLINSLIENEPQYVSNCGIVLLHPFLEMYFAEFDLLHKRKFKDDDARKRAVILLHYLATGETEGEEWNLLLQKMLCGLSFQETLPDQIEITGKEKEESERLLQSVINYCPPLKNTSLAGLRSTFLQRDGRLEKKENGWLLTTEQKTVDVLLDKIPWGFSTIKFPWLTDIITVDWY